MYNRRGLDVRGTGRQCGGVAGGLDHGDGNRGHCIWCGLPGCRLCKAEGIMIMMDSKVEEAFKLAL